MSSLFFMMSMLFMTTAASADTGKVMPASGGFETHKNIVYGRDTLQQSLDLYLPAKHDVVNTPVIVLIHGGAWVEGDKNDFNGFGLDSFFTANGCAVVVMNYRLDNVYKYPAQIDDVGLVMKFIRQKGEEWGVNANRVCLFGRSSGAHLALLYAYGRNEDNRVKAVIDGFGPTNFTDSTVVKGPLGINVTILLGQYESNKQLWHDASPIFYMNTAIPTVIFHGTRDDLIKPIQAQDLQDSLLSRGKPCMYINWTSHGHGWNQAKWNYAKVPIMAWLKQYL